MFLPPQALGGIPCVSITEDQSVDPLQLALKLEAAIPPPDLRIRMNPSRGMVNVPTWFWVEGYDGGTLANSETVLQQHKICHLVTDSGPDGLAALDDDGRPRTRQDCQTEDTTFDVGVRLWPREFAWDFGDAQGKDVACAGIGDCPKGLGAPFLDVQHPSGVQHPYMLSSLRSGAGAYTVQLGITFQADYRVSINGHDQGGWHSLPVRSLAWSASHEVQEAQAILQSPDVNTTD